MRVVLILLSILNFTLGISLKAQLPKASDYFPLQVGNVWEYDDVTQNRLDRYEVVSDTLEADSILVYKMLWQYKREQDTFWTDNLALYYYYNSDSTILFSDENFPDEPYFWEAKPDTPIYPKMMLLNTEHGLMKKWYIQYDYSGSYAILDTGLIKQFDEIWFYADVHELMDEPDTVISSGFERRYAAGLGPINLQNIWKITYAKINGIEYGTPAVVEQESKTPIISFSKDSIQLSPFEYPDSLWIYNLGDAELEIDSVFSHSTWIADIPLLWQTYVFAPYDTFEMHINYYFNPDNRKPMFPIRIPNQDSALFVFEYVDWCPVCKRSTNVGTYRDTLIFLTNDSLNSKIFIPAQVDSIVVSVKKGSEKKYRSILLHQNTPNPFFQSTEIRFFNPENAEINLTIHNIRGQVVRDFGKKSLFAGEHGITWNGQDNFGNAVANGVYLARLVVGGEILTRKMLLVR